MKGKIFVLTHGNDLDGLGSAALITRNLGAKKGDVFYLDYSKERLEYAIGHVLPRMTAGASVFICDTSLNDAHIPLFENFVKAAKKRGGNIFWLDHHYWTKRQVDSVASLCDIAIVGENEYACATEITGLMLHVAGRFDKELMKLAHYTDFNLSAKDKDSRMKRLAKMYSLAFAYYNSFNDVKRLYVSLGRMLSMLDSGKFSNRQIERDAKKFEKINMDRAKDMVKHLFDISDNIALGFSPTIDSTYACSVITKASGKDIGMYVNTRSMKCHIRSTKADVSLFAVALGGGGHPHAAAFNIKPNGYGNFEKENERKKFAEKISNVAKKFL